MVKSDSNNQQESQSLNGALNHSPKTDAVTGNSAEDKEEKASTSEARKKSGNSTQPSWLYTNPEVLASQINDLLALAQRTGWFVFVLPVTAGKASGVSITLAIPGRKLGYAQGELSIDDVPVQQWIEKLEK